MVLSYFINQRFPNNAKGRTCEISSPCAAC